MTTELTRDIFPFERVAVTGGTGTVGSVFNKVLLAQVPHLKSIITSYRSANSPRVKRLPESEKVTAIRGNVADPDIVRQMVDNADAVFHLAGWLANTALPEHVIDVYITNCLSAVLFGKRTQQQGKRFVNTSSHSVYFAGEYKGFIQEDTFEFRADFIQWISDVKNEYYRVADELLEGGMNLEQASAVLTALHEKFEPPFDPRIYDDDGYHVYCLTKLFGETISFDHGGVVLRLANVYGPGDDSVQAVGEACQRIMEYKEGDHLHIIRPFKKLVPAYLGDISKSLICASTYEIQDGVKPLFTVASQDSYLKEDALLRIVGSSYNTVTGNTTEYDIEELEMEDPPDFTYDLSKFKNSLLKGGDITPFGKGLETHLRWLTSRPEGAPLSVEF